MSASGLVEDIMGKEVDSGLYILSASMDKARSHDHTAAHLWLNNANLMQTQFTLPGDIITAVKVTSSAPNKTYTAKFSIKSSEITSMLQEEIVNTFNNFGFILK